MHLHIVHIRSTAMGPPSIVITVDDELDFGRAHSAGEAIAGNVHLQNCDRGVILEDLYGNLETLRLVDKDYSWK